MDFLTVNIGSAPNDGSGDTARQAFAKVNSNFTEVNDEWDTLHVVAFTGNYDDLNNLPVGGGGGGVSSWNDLQDIPASLQQFSVLPPEANKIFYYDGDSEGALVPITAFAIDVLALTDAEDARTLLELGSAAESATSDFAAAVHSHSDATDSVAGFMSATDKDKLDGIPSDATNNVGTVTSIGITGGDGITSSGGPFTTSGTFTLGVNASQMRTHLGLVIGTDVQAVDAELTAIAGLTSAANKLPYFTGSGTASLADFTSFARDILDDADASAVLTTLGVTTYIKTLLDDTDAATARTTLLALGYDIRTAATFTSNNPTLTANVLAIESDTGYMKNNRTGSTAWTSLEYLPLHVTSLITRLTAVEAAGGATYTELAGLIAQYAADGGEQVEPATATEIRGRADVNSWLTPVGWGDSWDSVSLAPSSNVITVAIASVPFQRAHSTITADTTATLDGLDGAERLHLVTASGGDWMYTPSADIKIGFDGRDGKLIRNGTSALFAYSLSGASEVVEWRKSSGDDFAEVALTPSAGTPDLLAIDGSRIPQCFYAEIVGDTEISSPTNLIAKPILGRLNNSSGGTVTITFNAGWEATVGKGAGVTIANGKFLEVLCRRQGSTDIISIGQKSD